MASTNFNYSPTTGTGNAQISVSAITINNGDDDKRATITVSNGVNQASVTLIQRYCPYFRMNGSDMPVIPSTGGSVTFVVHTEYDIVFRSVPDWITVYSGSTEMQEGQRIPASSASGVTFTITADPNTGEERYTSATFNMGHYIGNTLQQRVQYFNITQEADTSISVVPNEVVFDYNQTSGGTFQVVTAEGWTSSINDNA